MLPDVADGTRVMQRARSCPASPRCSLPNGQTVQRHVASACSCSSTDRVKAHDAGDTRAAGMEIQQYPLAALLCVLCTFGLCGCSAVQNIQLPSDLCPLVDTGDATVLRSSTTVHEFPVRATEDQSCRANWRERAWVIRVVSLLFGAGHNF